MRNKIAKSINVVMLISLLIGWSSFDAHAGLKKKVSVEPFPNPPNWSGPFDPGKMITGLTVKFLEHADYRLVPETSWLQPANVDGHKEISMVEEEDAVVIDPKEEPEFVDMDAVKAESRKGRHPAQVVVRGRILALNTKVIPGATKSAVSAEQVAIEVDVELYNPRTERIIKSKNLKVVAHHEKQAMNGHFDINQPSFRNSATGEAIHQISKAMLSFIHDNMSQNAFDADIIWVDRNKDRVLINAGANDGVNPFDSFTVYWLKKHYQDPYTKADMGDRYKQTGVIKIEVVHDDMALGRILAGNSIEAGSLVRARPPQ